MKRSGVRFPQAAHGKPQVKQCLTWGFWHSRVEAVCDQVVVTIGPTLQRQISLAGLEHAAVSAPFAPWFSLGGVQVRRCPLLAGMPASARTTETCCGRPLKEITPRLTEVPASEMNARLVGSVATLIEGSSMTQWWQIAIPSAYAVGGGSATVWWQGRNDSSMLRIELELIAKVPLEGFEHEK